MAAERTTIDLAAGCATDHCLKMAWQLKKQLDPDYSHGASLMPLSGTRDFWLAAHRTARKRVLRATRLGYETRQIRRHNFEYSIYEINTSTERRQGRPMGRGYLEHPTYSEDPPMSCARHHVYTHGVFDKNSKLTAYLWLYRCGDLAMVSSILGHAEHLEDGIMYLLFAGMLEPQLKLGGTLFYNKWDSGTDGLRFFKERVGMSEGDVTWSLV